MKLAALIILLPFCSMCSHVNKGSLVSNVVMDGGAWRDGRIPVCWEQSFLTEDFDGDRLLIRTVVESQYNERTLNIRFHGWELCSDDFPGLRVGLDNTFHSRVRAIGGSIAGIKNGLTFNFDPINQFSGEARSNLLKFVAVHEFGHVIGLMHEMNHPDFECPDWPQVGPSTPGAIPFHDHDTDSIMNNCTFQANLRTQTLDGTWKLSAGDIETIDMYYQNKIGQNLSQACSDAGGIWSVMRRAPGCCFNINVADQEAVSFKFCGDPDYIEHPMTGTREEILEDLNTLCLQRNLSLNHNTLYCEGK